MTATERADLLLEATAELRAAEDDLAVVLDLSSDDDPDDLAARNDAVARLRRTQLRYAAVVSGNDSLAALAG